MPICNHNSRLMNRLTSHPILEIKERKTISFSWNGKSLLAYEGEMISSALIANGIYTFGYHYKDKSPQGIFCANSQCAQCTVIANGLPVKSCMTPVQENMVVQSCDGLPKLPEVKNNLKFKPVETIDTEVLIIGGGPSGLSAAIELCKHNVSLILVDDRVELGGKLVLQTHKFFGSIEDCFAGTRGIDIAKILAKKLSDYPSAKVWTNSTVLFVFSDQKIGILRNNEYVLVKSEIILNAAGAREKMLVFPGNTLPGIYGAGAFQTLVNRDLVLPSRRIFIVGGGNVGLIAGYHALQAGITVVGLAEVMPQCGGYKVHLDKLKRLGVPVYTSHTVISANGKERVESVTIAKVNEHFNCIHGTEKTVKCDTILIAVGLDSINEFRKEAEEANMKVYSAGDAEEIAEASSAMFNGKIAGLKIAKELGKYKEDIPGEWSQKAEILKSPPGEVHPYVIPEWETGVGPILHCIQEIPCNPCISVCPLNLIKIENDGLLGIPKFVRKDKCTGCGKCLTICPGLAITLVDYRKDKESPIVSVPYEVQKVHPIKVGEKVSVVDLEGNFLDRLKVLRVRDTKTRTQIIQVKSPKIIAKKIAGIRIQDEEVLRPLSKPIIPKVTKDDVIVCRCERVTAGEIRKWIRKGVTDMNQLKQITRAGMGACGSKTCENLILKIYKEEGYSLKEIMRNTKRPLFIEVPFGTFAKTK